MLDQLSTAFDTHNDFRLDEGLLAAVKTGSHAYNLDGPDSDVDITAICIPPPPYIIGLSRFETWCSTSEVVDYKVYSIEKFVRLLLKSNPNSLEVLFAEPHLYEYYDFRWDELVKIRDAFISKKVFESVAGWAKAQIKSMESGKTKGYMGHKRKEDVQRLGFDAKDASHAYRLLFVGYNLAVTGEFSVWMEGEQRDIILDIKAGNRTLEEVKQGAQVLYDLARAEFERSQLPDVPNYEVAEKLLMELQEDAIALNRV